MDAREAAGSAVHEALPARWHVGPVSFDPGRHAWSVTAHGPLPGRGKAPQVVTGTGPDEVAALRDLDDRLRGVPWPDGGRLEELNRRLRQAYVAGAEEQSQRAEGRGLTADELERVLGTIQAMRSGGSGSPSRSEGFPSLRRLELGSSARAWRPRPTPRA